MIINEFTYGAWITTGAIGLGMCLLSAWKPQASRIVLGIFFLLMALGVNLAVLFIDPGLWAVAGQHAAFPAYRWFFSTILAAFPVPLGLLLIAFETTVAVLILSSGRLVKLGLLGGIVFCLWVMWIGAEGLTSPLIALALGMLWRREFPRSLWEMMRPQRKGSLQHA